MLATYRAPPSLASATAHSAFLLTVLPPVCGRILIAETRILHNTTRYVGARQSWLCIERHTVQSAHRLRPPVRTWVPKKHCQEFDR